MKRYRVQLAKPQQFEVIVNAESKEEAEAYVNNNWETLKMTFVCEFAEVMKSEEILDYENLPEPKLN